MPRMGKTEEDWNGLKLGLWKLFSTNSFSKLICAVCNFKNRCSGDILVCLESLLVSFASNFFAYFKFHSDWGRVTGKIKQTELDCRDTAPLRESINNKSTEKIVTDRQPWRRLKQTEIELENLLAKQFSKFIFVVSLTRQPWHSSPFNHSSMFLIISRCNRNGYHPA